MSLSSQGVNVRILAAYEVEALVGWAAGEGWNPGHADASAFRAADPDGFLGCFVDGRLAAGISAVRYGKRFGFIGLYICHPDFRGQGLGRRVWDAGMAHLDDRTIGLDGVIEQQENYGRMGFVPAYRTFRWSIAAVPSEERKWSGVASMDAADIPAISALDGTCFPAARSNFLEAWLRSPRQALVSRDGDAVNGYAVLRACDDGYKIGPIFAAGEQVAANLLQAGLGKLAGQAVQVDVPEYQHGFSHLLQQLGFQRGFMTTRMYRGAAPAVDHSRVFAITTLELG